MKSRLKSWLILVALGGAVGALAWQWQHGHSLQKRLAAHRPENAEVKRLRAENNRLQQVLTRSNHSEASHEVAEQIARVRSEIAELELRLKRPVPPATPTDD